MRWIFVKTCKHIESVFSTCALMVCKLFAFLLLNANILLASLKLPTKC
jgi:hypothetical protein